MLPFHHASASRPVLEQRSLTCVLVLTWQCTVTAACQHHRASGVTFDACAVTHSPHRHRLVHTYIHTGSTDNANPTHDLGSALGCCVAATGTAFNLVSRPDYLRLQLDPALSTFQFGHG